MIRYECDRCGCPLSANDHHRYILKMDMYAAAGPVEFGHEDRERDLEGELAAVLDELRQANPDDIEDQTYRKLHFDLCAACQRAFLKAPLGRSGESPR